MDPQEELALLSAVPLWKNVPKDRLASLAGYIRTETCKAGTVIFEEGAKGDGLYCIASGHVRIRKKVATADGSPAYKDLATLNPGSCMGEMTLFEGVPRSAQALACDDCVVIKLGKEQIAQWLKANPAASVDFLIGLVQVLSRRLRRASNELASLFDISQWLVEPAATSRDLLEKCLSHLMLHLDETWSAGAYLYDEINDQMELVASERNFNPARTWASDLPKENASANAWLDPHTYLMPLPGKKHLLGHLVCRTSAALSPEEKEESAMLLTTSSRLIASTLQSIIYRNEDDLRARLSSHRQQYGPGF